MNKYLSPFLFIPLLWLMNSCGNCVTGTGEVHDEERIVQEFSGVRLNCDADVIIRDRLVNEKNKVVISAQTNIMPLITTKVSGGALVIDTDGCVNSSEPIKVYVYVNEISKVTNDGSGSITSENALRGDEFEVNHNGSGNMKLMLKVNRLDVHLDGSGNITLDGNTDRLALDLNGSGEINGMSMRANSAKVNLDGSGSVSVFATQDMDLHLNGSGNIRYGGKPEKLNTKDDGSGEIHEAQ